MEPRKTVKRHGSAEENSSDDDETPQYSEKVSYTPPLTFTTAVSVATSLKHTYLTLHKSTSWFQVRSVIDEMSSSELCRPDLDLTAHINKLFPTEQSLSQLDSVMLNIEKELEELDVELGDLVEEHGQAAADGTSALAEAC